MMTGMPTTQHPLKQFTQEELWNSMSDYDRRNYIMCAGNYEKASYKGNRIFTVLSLYEIGKERIVKLRNPWEDFHWKGGLYSDDSDKWTPELKQEVGYYKGEKSCFYMDFKEYIN